MLSAGASSLSDAELLALLISTGRARENAVDLARRLLRLGGQGQAADRDPRAGLRYLVTAPPDELSAVPGIGPAKATRIKAAIELGRRLALSTADRPVIRTPADAAALVMESMRHLDRETFQVLFLNVKNQVVGHEVVSVGSLDQTPAHPREVFRGAVRRGAAGLVLCHNHPSGDPEPSPDDIVLTRRLRAAGEIIGIDVLDHIVIGDNRFASFRERGLL